LACAALNARPLLDLELCLGEATGAALAIPLLRAAVAAQNQMATFATAGIGGLSDSDSVAPASEDGDG
jgi:nicotinate-nucleotide--dimethylbenzimidazole phosphoribosyltransferase